MSAGVPSPFDGAPIVCYRMSGPCSCERCEPATYAQANHAAVIEARRAAMVAIFVIVPPHVLKCWRVPDANGRVAPLDCDTSNRMVAFWIKKIRGIPRDAADHGLRAARAPLLLFADLLERLKLPADSAFATPPRSTPQTLPT